MLTRTAPLLLVSCIPVAASAATLPIRGYTITEGLAHDHVSKIYRDSHDFLWICTDDGLSRFDGHRFVNYTTAEGLPHIHVNDIVESRGGDYWIATDGGVTLFRPEHKAGRRFVTFKPEGPPEALFVNAVLEDSDGSVLVGTAAGLYRMRLNSQDAARFERMDFNPPPDLPNGRAVNTLLIAGGRTLLVGASSGLYRRDAPDRWTRLTMRQGLPHNYVHRLLADTDGTVWACTRGGLARLQRGGLAPDLTITAADGLPHPDVRAVLAASDGRRWIATLGGLVEWRSGAPLAVSRVYSRSDGLTDNEIYALETDPAGNLWIGSRRGGLMRLRRPAFQNFGEADGLALSGTDMLVEPPSSTVCVAAISDPRRTIRCLHGSRFQSIVPRLPADITRVQPYSVYSTIVDHTGAWWISTSGGVFRSLGPIGNGSLTTSSLRFLGGLTSRSLYEDSRGDLWISTMKFGTGPMRWEFGLARWERATSLLHDYSGSLAILARGREPTALSEAAGQIWIGLSRPGGLLRWRDGRFQEISGSPSGTVQAIYRDRRGRLWVASAEAGLGRIDDPAAEQPALRLYDRSDGLSSNEIWCFAEDLSGRIYIGTARGVDRLDPTSGQITHWTEADGLAGGDIRSAICARNGDLWFLSNRGLSRFSGSSNEVYGKPLSTRIMAVRVAGTPQPVSETGDTDVAAADLPWYQNSVEIDFSAVDFQAPEQVRYQFLLDGGGSGWSAPAPNPTVHFSNLAPGSYRFMVRAISSTGIASGTPASFAFSVASPLWRRWWFMAIAGSILIGLAYFWHRSKLNRHLALERVRSRIATDLHDDIGASLARIAVLSEAIKGRSLEEAAGSRRMLGEIADTSRALVDAMSDIVWSIDPRRDSLADLIARLRAFGSDMLESRGISWTCEEAHGAAVKQALSPDQRREMYLILKEAIHNIARHSGAGTVLLRIEVRDDCVRAEIRDDGRGISPLSESGLGIESMRSRAARLGGKLEIGAGPQPGTQIRLDFPLSR